MTDQELANKLLATVQTLLPDDADLHICRRRNGSIRSCCLSPGSLSGTHREAVLTSISLLPYLTAPRPTKGSEWFLRGQLLLKELCRLAPLVKAKSRNITSASHRRDGLLMRLLEIKLNRPRVSYRQACASLAKDEGLTSARVMRIFSASEKSPPEFTQITAKKAVLERLGLYRHGRFMAATTIDDVKKLFFS